MNDWTPTTDDLTWTSNLFSCLRTGGVGGCPAGFSIWKKVDDSTVMLVDGPVNDGDTLPSIVPAEAQGQVVHCIETNQRVVICLRALGYRIVDCTGAPLKQENPEKGVVTHLTTADKVVSCVLTPRQSHTTNAGDKHERNANRSPHHTPRRLHLCP